MDIIVIGAGMAGLAAARTLHESEHTVKILEAASRVGGRVYTHHDAGHNIPIELGAEFIHGDQAPTWDMVRELGLTTLHWEKQADSLVRMESGELITMTEARQYAPFDITRSWDLPDTPVKDADEPLLTYLKRVGFTEEQLAYTRRSFVNAHGESIERISAKAALADMHDDTAGDGDYRVIGGYDQILRHLSHGLTILMNTVVQQVEWGGSQMTLTTDDERTYTADRVVITVPLGVLKAGHITFEPPLPEAKQKALDALQMGPGLKIVFEFEEPVLPEGVMALYSSRTPTMWWSPSYGYDTPEVHVLTAFATGDYARELLRHGDPNMVQVAAEALRQELGADALPPIRNAIIQDWTADPFTRGVYSTLSPGGGDAREVLGAPLVGRVFFAGEATAGNAWAATVHGAYASGQRAAHEILKITRG